MRSTSSAARFRLDPLGWARLRAYGCDALSYLGLAAATVPPGILIARLEPGALAVHAMSALVPAVAAVWAARVESGPAQATWGKRRERLVVEGPGGGRMSMRRALVRSALKIAVPWQIGHTVAIGAAFGGFERADPVTIAATAIVYPVVGVGLAAVLLRPGRAIHDRLVGSRVVSTDAQRAGV